MQAQAIPSELTGEVCNCVELRAVWEEQIETQGVAILIIHSIGWGFLTGGTPTFVSPDLTCGQCRNLTEEVPPPWESNFFLLTASSTRESKQASRCNPAPVRKVLMVGNNPVGGMARLRFAVALFYYVFF